MQVQTDNQPYDSINVTPMLDLAYVLLVVFILMTTATVQGLSMSLPKPSDKPSTEKHDVKIVQITAEGSVLVNGIGVSMSELESQLAAAKAREDGDERRAEGQRDEAVDDQPVIRRVARRSGQIPEEDADREQSQARHQHAGDRARAEGYRQPALQRATTGFGGADIGADGDVHADETRCPRQDRADQEGEGGCDAQKEQDQRGHDHADDGDGRILAAEIGSRPLLNRARNLLHSGVARRRT